MFYAYLQDVFLFDLSFQTLQFVGGAIIIIFSFVAAIENKIKADTAMADKAKNSSAKDG